MMEEYLEQAQKLHKENVVVDAHFDLAAEVYERRLTGERDVVERFYLPGFETAGLNIVVSSIYIASRDLPELGLRKALGQITALREDLEPIADRIVVAGSRKELEEALSSGRVAILLSLEGLDPLGNDVSLLRTFYDLGVRGAGLTWSRRNAFGTGCCKAGEFREIPGGLTELGREVIGRMEELGMWLDVSHMNNEGFADILKCARQPFLASHSNAWHVHPNYRNLQDDQILAIAKRGGVIGLNANAYLVGARGKEEGLEKLCAHVEYLVRQAGAGHVGYGFDLCRGLDAATPRIRFNLTNDDLLSGHADMLRLTAALLRRGMDRESLIGVLGGNFLRYYRQIMK